MPKIKNGKYGKILKNKNFQRQFGGLGNDLNVNISGFGKDAELKSTQIQQLQAEKQKVYDILQKAELAKNQNNVDVQIANNKNQTLTKNANKYVAQLRDLKNRIAPNLVLRSIINGFYEFFKVAVPYIVLFVVIILLIYGLGGGGGSGGKGGGRYYTRVKYNLSSFGSFGSWFRLNIADTSSVQRVFGMFNGGSHSNPLDRDQMPSGRCDNINWVETTEEGTNGNCDTSTHPVDIKWSIDNTQIPEFNYLPQARKTQLINMYSNVNIPWSIDPTNTLYVPQCDKAYYKDTCTADGVCVATNMFQDLGLSCSTRTGTLPMQYPSANGQPVQTFDDNANKTCINLNTLTQVDCPK